MNKSEIIYEPDAKKIRHNHLTRDVRPPGDCPRCDYLRDRGARADD